MDKCRILLKRLWQHDVDSTHKGRENIYVFTWKGKRIFMRPISPNLRFTKKKVSSLVSLCNQIDRNSKTSFLKREGLTWESKDTNQSSIMAQAESSIDRPVDWANRSKISRQTQKSVQDVGRPLGRPTQKRKAKASPWSTAQSTGQKTIFEQGAQLSSRSTPGRPTSMERLSGRLPVDCDARIRNSELD